MRKWINKFWEKRGYTEETQNMLDNFFAQLQEGSMLKVGQAIGTGCSLFILVIFTWLPFQEMGEDVTVFLWACFYFAGCSAICYLSPYVNYKEENKLIPIIYKLKFLPVSRNHLLIYRLRKLLWFCLRVFMVELAGQLLFSAIFFHELVLENWLYPLTMGLISPIAMGWLYIKFAQKSKG